jgi:hypothetical protein
MTVMEEGNVQVWWWFERNDGSLSPFQPSDNQRIEKAFQERDENLVALDDGLRSVIVSQRLQMRNGGRKEGRRVVRGVWHLELPCGSFEPYEEAMSDVLEKVFAQSSLESAGKQVHVGGDEYVMKTQAGGIIQKNQATGRELLVRRGYQPPAATQLQESISSTTEQGQLSLVAANYMDMNRNNGNVVIEMAKGYSAGYEEGRQTAGQLAKWLSPADVQQTHQEYHHQHHAASNDSSHSGASLHAHSSSSRKPVRPSITPAGLGQWFLAWGRDDPFRSMRAEVVPEEDNLALELAHKHNVESIVVTVNGEGVRINVAERSAARVSDGKEGKVLRGTWFFQRSDGSAFPYAENLADDLEAAFCGSGSAGSSAPMSICISGKHFPRVKNSDGICVDVGGGRKVWRRLGGDFVQFYGDGGNGRYVCRGWPRGGAMPSGPHMRLGAGSITSGHDALDDALEQPKEDHAANLNVHDAAGEARIAADLGASNPTASSNEAKTSEPSFASALPKPPPTKLRGPFRQAGQLHVDQFSCGLQSAVGARVHAANGSAGQLEERKALIKLDEHSRWMLETKAKTTGAMSAYTASTLNSALVANAAMDAFGQEALRRINDLGAALPRELGVVAVPSMAVVGQVLFAVYSDGLGHACARACACGGM